jgi:Spy/CpxP family protein refolding chaperone
MKTKISLLLITALCFVSAKTPAADKSKDPFHGKVFPPEVIMHFAAKIDLTDEQREFIMTEVKSAQEATRKDQQQLEVEMQKMGRIMGKAISGEEESERQIKRVLTAENAVKIAQWKLYIRLKNQLTREQKTQLAKLTHNFDPKSIGPSEELKQRLGKKIEQLKKGMQEMAQLGISGEKIAEITKAFQPLISARKYKEAEAVLDRALKKLDDPF